MINIFSVSTGSQATFPDNKRSHFTNTLAPPILKGDSQFISVASLDIEASFYTSIKSGAPDIVIQFSDVGHEPKSNSLAYIHSTPTAPPHKITWVYVKDKKKLSYLFWFQAYRYEKASDFVNSLNETLRAYALSPYLIFKNSVSGHIAIWREATVSELYIAEEVLYMLGRRKRATKIPLYSIFSSAQIKENSRSFHS